MKRLSILTRAHRFLALVIGIQVLFWTASGLFFTIWPIEEIRGEHLLKPKLETFAPASGFAALDMLTDAPIQSAHLDRMGETWTWRLTTPGGPLLVDAQTGERLNPLTKAKATELVNARWAGAARLVDMVWIIDPPREYFRPGPAWRAEFSDNTRLYVNPETGEARVVRTDLWRAFDVMWRFHIMDFTGDDRFDSWWMTLTALGAVLLTLAGFFLLGSRARRGMLFR